MWVRRLPEKLVVFTVLLLVCIIELLVVKCCVVVIIFDAGFRGSLPVLVVERLTLSGNKPSFSV